MSNLSKEELIGEINHKEDWPSFVARVSFTTIGGTISGGLPGGIVGFSAALLDGYLVNNNVVDKHYLSSSLYWYATVFSPIAKPLAILYPGHAMFIYGASYLMPTMAASLSGDFFDFRKKIELPLQSYQTMSRLFDEKEIISYKELERIYSKFPENPIEAFQILINDIRDLYNNKFFLSYGTNLALTVASAILENLFLYALGSYSSNLFISTIISNHNAVLANLNLALNTTSLSSLLAALKPLEGLIKEAAKIISLYIAKNGLQFLIDEKQASLLQEQFTMVIEKSNELILNGNNGRKILAHDRGREIVDNLTRDLYELLFNGANNFSKTLSETLKTLLALNNVVRLAPDAFAPYAVSLIPMQKLLDKIARELTELSEKLSDVQTRAWEIRADITENIEQINLRDGAEFVKYKYDSLLIQQNNITKQIEYNNRLHNIVSVLKDNFLEKAIDCLYFIAKIAMGRLTVEQIPIIKVSVNDLYSFTLSNINLQISNKDVIIAKNRIDTLFKIMSVDTDRIVRSTIEDNKVVIRNYTLTLDNKELVKIDNLEFIAGKHYAITGKSGCGKTSMLVDLKAGVLGALSSSGEIVLGSVGGKKAKIMFIDQKLYLPAGATLLEAIHFPRILQLLNKDEISALKEKIKYLFYDLEIDGFIKQGDSSAGLFSRLDSKEFALSGGQAKKVAIIQAILYKPDILVMDETFAGLDRYSIIKAEELLSRYLPDTIMLSVDHHAEDNNYNNFYDLEVHITNNTATILPINSRAGESNLSENASIADLVTPSNPSLIEELFNYFGSFFGE